MIISAILIAVVGIGFFMAWRGVTNEVQVVTAREDLAAYSFVDREDLNFAGVPEASIEDQDLTADEYEELYGDGGLVLTAQVLANQRLDDREIATGPQESFSVVLPDERVVAATTTAEGAAVGTVQAGDVVDVSREGGFDSGGPLVDFAKVICIASTPAGCQGVLPPGVDLSVAGSGEEGQISLLLAVPQQDATEVAGQNVTLSLNPFCRVDREGHFYTTRPGAEDECNAPGRLASQESEEVLGESTSENTTPEG